MVSRPEYFSLSHKRNEDLIDPYIWDTRAKATLDLVMPRRSPTFMQQADLYIVVMKAVVRCRGPRYRCRACSPTLAGRSNRQVGLRWHSDDCGAGRSEELGEDATFRVEGLPRVDLPTRIQVTQRGH